MVEITFAVILESMVQFMLYSPKHPPSLVAFHYRSNFSFLDHLDPSSTINFHTRTSNELRLVTSKEETIVCNINWVCEPSQRDIEKEFLEVLFCWWDADEGFEAIFY